MDTLIAEAWRIYEQTAEACVVRPSIPILFFGDSERYFRSSLKVVTVGLNPSREEFPDGGGLLRFGPARGIYPAILAGEHYPAYLHALNGYFQRRPYTRWFDSYEPLLNGLGCSYYDRGENAALHTDLCSPLATSPTWSGLTTGEQARLEPEGEALWQQLVDHLAPDLIVASVAAAHLRKIAPYSLLCWDTVYTVDRSTPYAVKMLETRTKGGKATRIIFGQAAQTPFGTVSAQDRASIGAAIRQRVLAR
jgi:hypothetical protein